ncbi:MAG: SRPBCC domain-containing protein [Deltaproteobacteria bacterium]|nr:SRPBCC domain-containing protein [Deltaproteobacteria bacterium]
MSNHQLESEIDIAATPERVWSILTDFSAYPGWNPFIRSIRGTPDLGTSLVVRIQPSGTKGMTFRPIVQAAVPGQELRWLGRFLMPGLFDGEHQFSIHPIAEGKIPFRQSERFSGILVPVFKGTLNRYTRRGFEEMNQALKIRAESQLNA